MKLARNEDIFYNNTGLGDNISSIIKIGFDFGLKTKKDEKKHEKTLGQIL